MTTQAKYSGLALAESIYKDRSAMGRELKKSGKHLVGHFLCHVPVEMITASGMVPYLMTGDMRRQTTLVNKHIETIMCSYARSTFNAALEGEYKVLDGLVVHHGCDNIVKLHEIWQGNIQQPYLHFINVPHVVNPASYAFFMEELKTFQKSLEIYTGRKITEADITNAIKLHNKNRGLVRQLYELRKVDPPLLTGAEMTRILVASMTVPVDQANVMLQDVIKDVKARSKQPLPVKYRLMLHGTEIDDSAFMELIEGLGSYVVIDDVNVGTRFFWHDADEEDDPYHALTIRHLDKIRDARTIHPRAGTIEEDLDNRFGHIRQFASDFKVKGVVFFIMRFCDTYGFDAPELKEYLKKAGFPVLVIEDEYNINSIARLNTRIQAFLETIA